MNLSGRKTGSKDKGLFQTAPRNWSIVLLLLFGLVAWRATTLFPKEKERYNKSAEEYMQRHIARKNGEDSRTSKQERFHVVKHLWLSEKEPRLELELRAARSEVGLTMVKAQGKLLEKFKDVEGLCQEELFYKDSSGQEYVVGDGGVLKKRGEDMEAVSTSPLFASELIPMQRFRYFESEEAVYDYHSHTLVASQVNFWNYVVPGHKLIASREDLWPESSGSCASMTVCHLGTVGSVQFSAEQLNMQVTPKW